MECCGMRCEKQQCDTTKQLQQRCLILQQHSDAFIIAFECACGCAYVWVWRRLSLLYLYLFPFFFIFNSLIVNQHLYKNNNKEWRETKNHHTLYTHTHATYIYTLFVFIFTLHQREQPLQPSDLCSVDVSVFHHPPSYVSPLQCASVLPHTCAQPQPQDCAMHAVLQAWPQ